MRFLLAKRQARPPIRLGLIATGLFFLVGLLAGCVSHSASVVKETDEYSFDKIRAQAAAEEAASAAEREE